MEKNTLLEKVREIEAKAEEILKKADEELNALEKEFHEELKKIKKEGLKKLEDFVLSSEENLLKLKGDYKRFTEEELKRLKEILENKFNKNKEKALKVLLGDFL